MSANKEVLQEMYLKGFDGGVIAAYKTINNSAVRIEALPKLIEKLEKEYEENHPAKNKEQTNADKE